MSKNDFTMKHASIIVASACNLNCKLCAGYAPYVEKNGFPDFEELLGWVKKYFRIVSHVELLTISGGEPLLYKHLPNMIEFLMEYCNCFDQLEIYSNGTIIPSDTLIEKIKQHGNKFRRFIIDNYGKNISTKISIIKEKLDNYSIPYVIRDYCSDDMHCGGWIDYGSLTKPIHTYQESLELFSKCAYPNVMKFCFSIRNGLMIPCPPINRRLMLNQTVDKNDYIDLTDNTLSIEQQQEKITYIYETNCLETCQFCNGMCDDSPRFKPAEQFTLEEIRQIRQKKT